MSGIGNRGKGWALVNGYPGSMDGNVRSANTSHRFREGARQEIELKLGCGVLMISMIS